LEKNISREDLKVGLRVGYGQPGVGEKEKKTIRQTLFSGEENSIKKKKEYSVTGGFIGGPCQNSSALSPDERGKAGRLFIGGKG